MLAPGVVEAHAYLAPAQRHRPRRPDGTRQPVNQLPLQVERASLAGAIAPLSAAGVVESDATWSPGRTAAHSATALGTPCKDVSGRGELRWGAGHAVGCGGPALPEVHRDDGRVLAHE